MISRANHNSFLNKFDLHSIVYYYIEYYIIYTFFWNGWKCVVDIYYTRSCIFDCTCPDPSLSGVSVNLIALINRPSTPVYVIVFAKFFPMKLGQVRFITRIVMNAFKESRMINDSQWMTRRSFIAIILRRDPTFRFVSSLRKLFSFFYKRWKL